MDIHPAANAIRMMTDDEYSALRDDIEEHGLHQPIVLCDGMILDGRNRERACTSLGIKARTTTYKGDDPIGYVLSLNVKRRHLTDFEKVLQVLPSEPEIKAKAKKKKQEAGKKHGRGQKKVCQKSDKAIDTKKVLASKAGVSHDTVSKVKAIEKKADDKTKQALIDGDLTINAAYKKINVHVGHNAGESEWYTPQEYIDAARKVMGSIDVDPATTREVNKRIKAKKFYTKENSGLAKKWIGNVWMNPPYKQPLVKDFCVAFAEKFKEGDIKQGFILINNTTETSFGQGLLDICDAVCFPAGRVKFLDIDGKPGAPLQGQMLLYLGPNTEQFFKECEPFGICLERMK